MSSGTIKIRRSGLLSWKWIASVPTGAGRIEADGVSFTQWGAHRAAERVLRGTYSYDWPPPKQSDPENATASQGTTDKRGIVGDGAAKHD